jgi:hypothetical protein
MAASSIDYLSRRVAVLGLSASALFSVAKTGRTAAKGKGKGKSKSGKCRCRARQVCRCPRCPIDILADTP